MIHSDKALRREATDLTKESINVTKQFRHVPLPQLQEADRRTKRDLTLHHNIKMSVILDSLQTSVITDSTGPCTMVMHAGGVDG